MSATLTPFEAGTLREVFEGSCPPGTTVEYREATLTRLEFTPAGYPIWKVAVGDNHLDTINPLSFKSVGELRHYLNFMLLAVGVGICDETAEDLRVEPFWMAYF